MTTAVCISSTRGLAPFEASSYTIATSAPTSSFDFEIRYNLTDQNGAALNKLDLIKFLEAVKYGLESMGGPIAGQFFKTAASGSNFTGPQI